LILVEADLAQKWTV